MRKESMTTEERLEKLEKELAGAKTCRAEKFEMVDSAGAVRAALRMAENGTGPTLRLYDQKGRICADLSLGEGPMLELKDHNGRERVEVREDGGGPRLMLFDQKRGGSVMLSADCVGQALNLTDQNGKLRAGLMVLADGRPSLELADQNGETRVMVVLDPALGPQLRLCGQDGKVRAGLAVGPPGWPILSLQHQNGEAGATLGVLDGKPTLELCDQHGRPIWSKP
jgi:hypothetical protein